MNPDERTIGDTKIREIVDISKGGKKNIILDATVLTALMGCPRSMEFRFNYNFLSIKGKSNSLECGSLVHKFLEVYYRCIINGMSKERATQYGLAATETYIRGCPHCTDFVPTHGNNTNRTLGVEALFHEGEHRCTEECILKPKCGHRINEYPGLKNTPKDSADYKIGWQAVLDTCDAYAQFWRNDHWVPLEVEVVKGEVLYEDEEIRVLWKAKLDLVSDTNQGIFPVDHKTMKQRRDTLSLNNQFMGQCILMRTRNIFINKIGFQATLKPEEKFIRPPISYSAARLFEFQSETLPFYAKLLLMYAETEHFPPNYGHCETKYGNCAFVGVCQSDPAMRETELKLNFMVGPEWNPTNEDE